MCEEIRGLGEWKLRAGWREREREKEFIWLVGFGKFPIRRKDVEKSKLGCANRYRIGGANLCGRGIG